MLRKKMLRPDSVKQMIQVLVRFRNKYSRSYNVDKAHIAATTEVAQQCQITRTTIHDLCCRRLNLPNITRFRNLLAKWMLGDSTPLLELLKRFTPPRFHAEIEKVLTKDKTHMASLQPMTHASLAEVSQRLDEGFNFSVDPDTAKKLKVLSLMEGISTSDWLKNITTDVVKREYKTWLNSQEKV